MTGEDRALGPGGPRVPLRVRLAWFPLWLLTSELEGLSWLLSRISRAAERASLRLGMLSWSVKRLRDELSLRALIRANSRGCVVKDTVRGSWEGLTVEGVDSLLRSLGCRMLGEIDYDDMVNYEAYYACDSIGRIVGLHDKTKTLNVEYLCIWWEPLTDEGLARLRETLNKKRRILDHEPEYPVEELGEYD